MDFPQTHPHSHTSRLPPLPPIPPSYESATRPSRSDSQPPLPSPYRPHYHAHSHSLPSNVFPGQLHTHSLPHPHHPFITQTRAPSSYWPPDPSASGWPSTTEGEIMLPPWQPDSSATSCPICYSVFTFFLRRHHCRKCGRVVCAACSPHRITIPRAFVVKPPMEDHEPGSSEDDDEDDEALEVRICDDCLGRRNARVAASHGATETGPMPMGGSGGNGSGGSRRRRMSTQGGRSVPHPHAPISRPSPGPRLQLAETDYCPICHRPLPFLSDPSEEGREAHIAACITSATSSPPPSNSPTPAPGGRGRSYTNAGRMVVWKATRKDCTDSEGDPVECVICFEEFEEEERIARLECLCRYHETCIKSWFDKKGSGECPVHAVHE